MFRNAIICSILFLGGCAIQSAPEGGPKDVTPPTVLQASPENKTINFKASEIVLTFDEYVQVTNFGNEFFSSPPLQKRIDYRLKGKKLYLTLDEELRENTTYTFSFGSALQDNTEGNVQADYKYVFATGDVLDSLHIHGSVVDAYTGLPEEKAIAMLYPAHLPDSLLIKQKPIYYAITNAAGEFQIENLAADTFQVIAITDKNLNLLLDEGIDKIGFIGEPVPTGVQIAEPIRLFNAKVAPKFIDAGQKGYGKIALTFTRPTKHLNVEIAGNELFGDQGKTTFLEPSRNGDTAVFWFNPLEYPDDVSFLMLNLTADSLREDSVRVLLQKAAPPALKLAPKSLAKMGPADTLFLQCPVPIVSINQSLVSVMQDSLPVPFELSQIDSRKFALYFAKKPAKAYEILFQNEALTDLYGRLNDSIALKTVVATDEEKAIVKFRITAADNRPKIFELIQGNKALKRIPFTTEVNFDMSYIEPGKYGIRIIWDDNQNNRWDAGILRAREYPEQVMYYPKPIELRANWEMDVVWDVPEP
jgi:hypothetical protein